MKVSRIALFISTIIGAIALVGCSNNINTSFEYKKWCANQENGLVKTKQIGHLHFYVQRKPKALVALAELEEHPTLNQDSLIQIYAGSDYYMLDISWKDENNTEQPLRGKLTNYQEYAELVNQLSYSIAQNIKLEYEGEQIEPSIVHYEPGYELARSNRFMISFPAQQDLKASRFVFNDQYFGTGVQKFKFDEITNIPELPSLLKNKQQNIALN